MTSQGSQPPGRPDQDLDDRAVAANGLVMVGKEPLPENRVLVEASIQAKPRPFTIWALVRLSRPERDAFRVELQPYALSGEVRSLWNQLVTGGDGQA